MTTITADAALAATPEAETPKADPMASKFLTVALCIYFVLYATEGFTRWVLNMAGLDALIFIRDALVLGGVGHVLLRVLMKEGRIEPVAGIFFALLLLHGAIGYANLKGMAPIVAGAKPYLSLLIGAYVARRLFGPNRRRLMAVIIALWAVGFVSAGIEKYAVDWPWIGMTAEIAGQKVEVSRDWQVGSADKRAAGLARSSIHLAGVMSVFGIILFFAAKAPWLRLGIALLTTVAVFWSTQKGALIAIVIVFLAGALPRRFTVGSLKWALIFVLLLMIALPLVLPGYVMPSGESGVFSMQSFYDRAQRMWPDAWDWYAQRATPLFGVGLGGIGFAMRLYSPEAAFYAADLASYEPYLINFADNMYIYIVVQLGVMAFVYLGFAIVAALRVDPEFDPGRAAALGVLTFCIGYGIAVSIIEDQIACMFLGASVYYLWCDGQARRKRLTTSGDSKRDIYAVPFVSNRPRRRPVAAMEQR